MNNLTDFYLAGHSYGGYVVSLYALRYAEHLKKLLLISPVGFQFLPPNWSFKRFRFDVKKFGLPRWAYFSAEFLWKKKVSPLKSVRILGQQLMKKTLREYVEENQGCKTEDEAEALTEYLLQIFSLPGTSEEALFIQFNPGLICHKPLVAYDKLASRDFPISVSYIYGDRDWVDSSGSEVVVKANRFFQSGQSQLHIIKDADHNMQMDNPKHLVEKMTGDLLGTIKYCYETKEQSMYYVDDDENPLPPYIKPVEEQKKEKELLEEEQALLKYQNTGLDGRPRSPFRLDVSLD